MSGARGFMRFLERATRSPVAQAVSRAWHSERRPAQAAANGGMHGRMTVEEVEPRILHSADLSPFVAADAGASVQVEMRVVETPPPAVAQTPSTQQETRHEVVVVDSAVPDYQKLVDDIVANADASRQIDVVVLQPGDGIRTITDALAGRSDIDALHIISHGADGTVYLGGDKLDLDALAAREAELARWGSALSADADILIYGCDVARDAGGRALVDGLARVTGADVAASDDPTGASARGGDWLLEFASGTIETAVAPSASGQAEWQFVLAPNNAPVLTGANALTTINEDAVSNTGTLVSDLLAGQVTDADAGALAGIAVTAVDNTHGAWQYSTDNGVTWANVSGVSASNALLLDGSNKVRFVPAANWNGFVGNGITFRAWDETSGVAGGSADTTQLALNVRDNFSVASYTNNDGSASWSAGWVDSDGSPTAGQIQISAGTLQLDGALLSSSSIYREVNLAGTSGATLTFDYSNTLFLGSVTLDVSSDGGANYTTLSNTFAGSAASFDLSAYAATNTRIRFTVSGVLGSTGTFVADNLQIGYTTALNGGTTAFSTAARSSGITVNAVNDAPSGAAGSVTMLEDGVYTFAASAFGFTDPVEGNSLAAVKITTLATAGTLAHTGTGALTAGQLVSVADINAGKLVYTPAANANGAPYASFTFQVQDDGGTANGGVDLDPTPRTMTVNVTAVNDAPSGASRTVTTLEDTGFVFAAASFGFTDTADSGANTLAAVKVTVVPTAGALTLTGSGAVAAGQLVSIADINAGKLVYTPATNANGAGYASFKFRVQDDGGTANGGVDLDATERTMTIDVTAVNDAPSGASRTVTTLEDTGFVFAAASFGFTDTADSGANTLAAVKVTVVPTAGALTLTGSGAVAAGQLVSIADINAGKLVYTPATNANGAGYASFKFRVQDDGGTANGGVDLDATERTMTIDVTAVNDAPSGASAAVTTLEDTAYTFTAASFGFSDVDGNALAAVKIVDLPLSGSLTLNGTAVTSGQLVTLASLNSNLLRFTPANDANGAAYASFTFQVQDDGGTANGGVDLDATKRTMTINVTAVQDAPTLNGTNNLTAINEDAASNGGTLVSSLIAGHFGDPDAGALSGIAVTGVDNTNGSWQYSINAGGSWTAFGAPLPGTARLLAADALVRFVPNANWNGAVASGLTFRAWDRTTGVNGGIAPTIANPTYLDRFGSVSYSNNDGTAAWASSWIDEADSDPVGGRIRVNANQLELRTNGVSGISRDVDLSAASAATLSFSYNNGILASDAAVVALKLSSNGGSSYTTVASFSGTSLTGAGTYSIDLAPYLSASTRVRFEITASSNPVRSVAIDNVQIAATGAGSGGATAYSTATATAGITVNAVNDAPVGANNTVTALEDNSYAFSAASFGFTDPVDSGANSLAAVKIATLATAGTLNLIGSGAVTAGQMVSVADINAGKLVFTPAANANGAGYASFTFQVQDDGGTANGGVDLDATARTMTINVTAVNDAPTGASNTVTTNEDTQYVFAASAFGFSDAADAGANSLAAVKITSLPTAGTLTLNNVAVTAGQFVSVANITAGNLRFNPAANANGAGYASFTFQVQDNGGTAYGGVDLDATARTMTINVTAVNDAPTGANNTVTINEDTSYVFTAAAFGFSDAADGGAGNLAAVKITSLPTAGTLTLNNVAVTAGQFVSVANINAGNLRFSPAGNANGTGYASFTFQVQDDGGTANGGVDLDATARTMTINVTAVNDAPAGANNTVTTNEDTQYVFAASAFGFSDAADAGANSLAAVKITSLPTAGTLTLNNVAVTAGQFVSVANITAGNLRFNPAANANGTGYSSFTFQVQDDGGTANGGVDLDTTARTMTINVTAVQDAPTLTGANALTAVNEDATTNSGTLVSSLIAGRFGDVDASALSGIAVIAIDDAHGTWQYSINAGSTWNDFGATLAGSARLLASDARVRFVPDANWNGTVSNGLTFRAWDRTTGVNGGVAPTIANPVFQDDFSTVSYTNNDGTAAFSGAWVDGDQDPGSGRIRVRNGLLEISTKSTGGVYRDLDLSGTTGARLSFTFTNGIAADDNSVVAVQISSNGGASYATLGTFSANSLTGSALAYADISAYRAANTRIRFEVTNADSKGTLWIGSVQIAASAPGNGGSTAFSTATAASDVVVIPVNDAPSGANKTVTTLEDTSYVFGTADFGYADATDAASNAGANAFSAVRITTVPTAGSLRLNGVAVTAGQFVSASDIAAGKLAFAPAADASGSFTFTFQVQDDGGTANGGVDLDPTPATMTINVTELNDAPVGTAATRTVLEGGSYVFNAASFGFTDPHDNPVDKLKSVTISTLPSAGTLTLKGAAVTSGQSITASDIAGGNLVYRPAANANGTGYASFTFQVRDDGGTANGGIDLDPIARAFTFDVTPVNDAPVGADSTVTLLEDTARAFAIADFGFSDPVDGGANSLAAVKIVTVPGAGSLTLNGVAVTAGQSITAADIAGGKLAFRGAADANGTGYAAFTFRVQDNGGTANGGIDTDPLARTMRVNITAVNDAPTGADTSVGTLENTPFVFTTSAFGFSDARDGNRLLAVKIDTLPAAGMLTLNGTAVAAGQIVSASDIAAGRLVYAPPANQSGLGVGRFTFQVQDDGGTANGGTDFDPTPNTLTIDVGPINHAPTGADATVVINEDSRFVFAAATFGYSDENDVLVNNFAAVRITSLPSAGALTLGGVAVSAGQLVSVADLAAGKLLYTPGADGNGAAYASFTFQVQDDGGTANGGTDLDQSPNSITFNVLPVNDAPRGSDATARIDEDTSYTFAIGDFGFSDASDGNGFRAVRMASLPTGGALTLNGVAVAAGQSVAADDIAAGKLVYRPNANANGTGYARFTFQVQDDGGVANGGSDTDGIARTFTLDVTSVNDAPTGASATVTIGEDSTLVLNVAAFGFSDPMDAPANALRAVTITTLPTTGTLALNGVAVTAGQSIVAADIAAGRLAYTPLANQSGAAYASFGFIVQDDGGGADTDSTERYLTINVVPVNDAPSGTDATLATNEDTAIVVPGATFGFSDAVEHDSFLAVKISSLPTAGTLTLGGVAVAAGQSVSAADIAAGRLVYTPGANGNGVGYASFGFQVQDDGGTANGGSDLDPVARRVTFDVAAIDDAPTGRSSSLTLNQDATITLTSGTFGFSDAADTPANAFLGVNVVAPPSSGTLTLAGTAVTAGQFVTVADLDAGKLVYAPAAGGSGNGYASLGFKVQDSGAAGANVDTVQRALTFNVTARVAPPVVIVQAPVVPVVTAPPTVTEPTVQSITQTSSSSLSSSTSSSSSSSTSTSTSTSTSSSTASSGDKQQSSTSTGTSSGSSSGNTQSAAKTVDQGASQRAAADAAAGAAAGAGAAGAGAPGAAAQIAVGGTEVRPIENVVQGVGGVQRLDSQVRSETRNAMGPMLNVVSDAPLLLASVQQGESLSDLGRSFGLSQSSSSSNAANAAVEQHRQIVRELEEVRDTLREQTKLEAAHVAASASAAVSLSVGYVVWLLRGGVLVSTFLSSLPAWRLVDPLPILERLDEENGEDDDSLESLVARTNQAATDDEAPQPMNGVLQVEAV